jgi:hypothetical protein
MIRRFLTLFLLAVLTTGCGAMQLCPQRHAIVRQPAMSCAEMNQLTAAAVKRLGYNIDSFVPATNEQKGNVQGTRRTDYDDTYKITVEMQCSPSEAVADAVSTVGCASQLSFPNDFQQSFASSMSKRSERPEPKPQDEEQKAGLSVEVEPQRDGDKAVGASLAAANLIPVKVTIVNRTSRVYRVEADSITLISQAGATVEAVSPTEAAARVGRAKTAEATTAPARLQDKSLKPGLIEPGAKVEGWLYLPRQAYRRANVKLIDQEAEEPEGFTVEF